MISRSPSRQTKLLTHIPPKTHSSPNQCPSSPKVLPTTIPVVSSTPPVILATTAEYTSTIVTISSTFPLTSAAPLPPPSPSAHQPEFVHFPIDYISPTSPHTSQVPTNRLTLPLPMICI